jgi:exonuclease III/ribonuclease HI
MPDPAPRHVPQEGTPPAPPETLAPPAPTQAQGKRTLLQALLRIMPAVGAAARTTPAALARDARKHGQVNNKGQRGQPSITKYVQVRAQPRPTQPEHPPSQAAGTPTPRPAAPPKKRTQKVSSHLKLMAWNVRGAHSSQHCIQEQINEQNPDVLVLCETLGNKNPKPAWLTQLLGGYSYWHSTRQVGNRGIHGVLLAMREHVAMQGEAKPVELPPNSPAGRIQAVTLTLDTPQGATQRLLLVGTYWPSGSDPSALQERQRMTDCIAAIQTAHAGAHMIMLGDMNAAAVTDDREPGYAYLADSMHQGFIADHKLSLLPEPRPRPRTFQGTSRIDDVLVGQSVPTAGATVTVAVTGAHSDHSPVLATLPASSLNVQWPAAPPPLPLTRSLQVKLPISKADKEKFKAEVANPASGIPAATRQLTEMLAPAVSAAQAFFLSLEGHCSGKRKRMQVIEGESPQKWLDKAAKRLDSLLQLCEDTMKRTCDTTLAVHGGRHFRPRMISKLRAQLTCKLRAARLLLHHRADEVAAALSRPLQRTISILRRAISDGGEDADSQLHAIVDQTRKTIKAIDQEHNAEARKAAKVHAQHMLDAKPKQAHKAIFKKGAARSSLSALKHPATGEIATDKQGVLHAAWSFFANMLQAPGPKTGRYLPDERSCADFPFTRQSATDRFTLKTAATELPQRPWLHTVILDKAAFLHNVSQLGNKKAPGPDGVINEMIKMLPNETLDIIHSMFVVMWATGTTPTSWKESDTVLLYKLQDADPSAMTDLANYRPIGLANTLYKLWTKVITAALSEFAEEHSVLSSVQAGFRKQKATMDQLQQLVHVLEDARLHKQDAYCLVVDLKAAFNSTDQDKLLYIMHSLGFGTDAIEVVRGLYTGATTSIRLPAGRTEPVNVDRGTIQGDTLSPFLFLVYLEPLLRWLHAGGRGYKHGCLSGASLDERLQHAVSSLAYADDLNILTGGPSGWCDMRVQADKLTHYCDWGSLQVSHKKTKITGVLYGAANKGEVTSPTDVAFRLSNKLQVQGAPVTYLPPTEPFPYLGVLFTMVLDWRPQKAAMTAALKEKLSNLQASFATPRQAMRMLRTVIVPSVAYSFPVVPCSPDEIDVWDKMIARAARKVYGLMRSSPTAMVREDISLGGMGCASLMVEYATRNTQALMRGIWDEGSRMGAVTSALLDQQLDLLGWVASTQGCVRTASRYCMRARQLLLTHMCQLRLMQRYNHPYQERLEQLAAQLHTQPTAVVRAVRHLLAAGITSWEHLLDSARCHVIDGAALRARYGSRKVRKLQVASLNRLAALLNLDHEPSQAEEEAILQSMTTDMRLPASSRVVRRASTLEALSSIDPCVAWLRDKNPAPKQGKIPDWFRRAEQGRRAPPRAAGGGQQGATPDPRMQFEGRRSERKTVHRLPTKARCTVARLWDWKQYIAETWAKKPAWKELGVCEAMYTHRWLPAKVTGMQTVRGQLQYIVQWKDTVMERWAAEMHQKAGLKCHIVQGASTPRSEMHTDDCNCELCFESTVLGDNRCRCCHRTFHTCCLMQHGLAREAPPVDWMCPACMAASEEERASRGSETLVHVSWDPTNEPASLLSGIPGGQELINDFQAGTGATEWVPEAIDRGMDDMARQGGLRTKPWYTTLGKAIRGKFHFHTQAVNPQLDICPTGKCEVAVHAAEHCTAAPETAPTVKPQPPATASTRVASAWGADGKHRGMMATDRLVILKRLYGIGRARGAHTAARTFADEVCGLMGRARACKRTLHAMPRAMMQAVRTYLPMFDMELHSSPLTVDPETSHYWTECPGDVVFSARTGSRAQKHVGFATAVPEHTDEGMCAAVKHAVLSAVSAKDKPCATLLLLRAKPGTGYHNWVQSFPHVCTSMGTIRKGAMPLWCHKPGCAPGYMYPTYHMHLLMVWNAAARRHVAAAAAARTGAGSDPNHLQHMVLDAGEQLASELGHVQPAPGSRIVWHPWYRYMRQRPRQHKAAGCAPATAYISFATSRAPSPAPVTPFKFRQLPEGTELKPLLHHTWESWCLTARDMVLHACDFMQQGLVMQHPDWRTWAYTDGSKLSTDEGPAIGAAVYVPATQSLATIRPEAGGLTSTINNAELTGIHTAMDQGHMVVATDSSSSQFQIRNFVYWPMTMLMHTHRHLLHKIVELGERSAGAIHIYKVKAHSGIIGNEGADAGAKFAARNPQQCDVKIETPANPFEDDMWLYTSTSEGECRPLHDLGVTLKAHMHKLHKLGQANVHSLYYTSWQKVWDKNGLKGMCKHSNAFMADSTIPHAAKRSTLQYRQGVLWNGKLAMRCHRATSSACPLCGAPDSGHHILAGPCPKLANMVTERHNEAGRLICKAISKGKLGRHMVSMDVGSTHRLQTAGVALELPRQAPAWLLNAEDWAAIKQHNEGKASVPDVVLVTHEDGESTWRPETDLPTRAIVHLVEVKYCRDTMPEDQLARATAQHQALRDRLLAKGFGAVALHPILLGVGGTVYTDLTRKPLLDLGVDRAACNALLSKLHKTAVTKAGTLVGARRAQERTAGWYG